MERRFREDENELPYLVSSKRDDYTGGSPSGREIKFTDKNFSEFEYYVNLLYMSYEQKKDLIDSVDVKANNCIFSIEQSDGIVSINLRVWNRYLVSYFYLSYDEGLEFRFDSHSHEGLESMGWFESETRRVESEINIGYWCCGGGFKNEFLNGNFCIKDELNVIAFFGNGESLEGNYHEYKVDFENKKLNEYHVSTAVEMFVNSL